MALTQKQIQAINADGRNILVSASAGSGKTFVMINRIVKLIIEGKANVDEILCVTFTKLASKEIKQRLNDEINKKISKGQDVERLSKQLQLLPQSNICTIDSFCNNLLREFFYVLDIDSDFKIMSNDESKNAINRAINDYFEKLYEQNDANFNVLLKVFFANRNDNSLKELILEIYNYIICEANPLQVLQNGKRYYTSEGIYEIYDKIKEYYQGYAKNLQDKGVKLYNDVKNNSYDKMTEYLNTILILLENFINCNDIEKMNDICKVSIGKKPNKNYELLDEDRDNEVVLFKEAYGELVDDFKTNYGEGVQKECEKAINMADIYNALYEIVSGFISEYQSVKRQQNYVDYADLEHFVYDLLQNEQVASEIRSRFKYIFADEYQDVNGVQEGILSTLSNDNIFMVGDIKQSIYAFRGCNPTIFAKKAKQYANSDNIYIELDKNFRSTKNVIATVNSIFSDIMTEKFGSVDYANNNMIFGADYPEGEGETALHLLNDHKEEDCKIDGVYSVSKHIDQLNDKKGFAEGKLVAKLILENLGMPFYDLKKKMTRDLEYGDMVILLRSPTKNADRYIDELSRCGIPASAEGKKSLGEYAEIALLIDLLKLIDCFNQDIPLASVLKSPIGNLTESMLLKIRKTYPKCTFCEAYYNYLNEQNDEITDLLTDFNDYFNKIRLVSEFVYADQLLSQIIREKNIDVNLLSSRLGERKLARVNTFINAIGVKQMTVRQIIPLLEYTLDDLTMTYQQENSVQILSIHGSKGLEFPLVILANIENGFNELDLNKKFIIDRNYGLSLKYYDVENKKTDDSVFRNYVKLISRNAMREEEMRLLYVATTRAKNILYVVGQQKQLKSGDFSSIIKENRTFSIIEKSNCYAKMLCKKDMPCIEYDLSNDTTFTSQPLSKVIVGKPNKRLKDKITKNLSFKYSNQENTNISIKRSVTSVAHFDEDDAVSYEFKPIISDTNELSGTAYHRFLEVCDFYKTVDNQLIDLYNSKKLTDQQLQLLDKNTLTNILNMPIFNQLKGYSLYREQPFTAFISQNQIDENSDQDTNVLVQGIIDLLAIKDNKAIIVDYKYSSVTNKQILIDRYFKQLKLYSIAVENVLKIKVESAYLVNIKTLESLKLNV